MNTDIRLSVEFFDHPKTIKLQRRLGLEAVIALQRLWLWAARNRPDGRLCNMDSEDIEIAARWEGEPGKLYGLLVDPALGWIDQQEGGPDTLHDWQEHNPWQAEARSRSDASRFSRLAGSFPQEYRYLLAAGVSGISAEEYRCIKEAKQRQQAVELILAGRGLLSPVSEPATEAAPAGKPKPVPSAPGNTKRAKAKKTGPDDALLAEPDLEFVELRSYYSRNARAEAPMSGFNEYTRLRASSFWPGQGVLYDSIDAHLAVDIGWKKGFAPGLARFLRERWWSRAPKKGENTPREQADANTLLEKNLQTAAQALAERKQRCAAASQSPAEVVHV